jgi:hypothetical protein
MQKPSEIGAAVRVVNTNRHHPIKEEVQIKQNQPKRCQPPKPCLFLFLLLSSLLKSSQQLILVESFSTSRTTTVATSFHSRKSKTRTTTRRGRRSRHQESYYFHPLLVLQEQFSTHQNSVLSSSSDDDYQFWEESLSIQSFNMDLHNLAMEDPQKAQDALEIMEQLYTTQEREQQQALLSHDDANNNTTAMIASSVVRPDSASYTICMEGWCYGGAGTSGSRENDDDSSLYNSNKNKEKQQVSFISSSSFAHTRPATSERAHRVQSLLDRMEDAPHLQPNEISYLLACQQWADAVADETPLGQNVQRAQDLLDRLLVLQQNDQNQVLSAEQDHGDGDDSSSKTNSATPNTNQNKRRRRRKTIPISTKLYSIVMEGWCRRVGKVPHAMERVESLLEDMEAAATDKTNPQHSFLPRPNVLTYTSVIGGFARSRQRNLATKAMTLLPRMQAHGVEPDMVAYTSILNCWAKTRGRDERQQAHTQALQILKDMEDMYTAKDTTGDEEDAESTTTNDGNGGDPRYHIKPNAITYATAIKAIGNSLANNAPVLVEEVLQRMCNLTQSGVLHIPPTVETYNAVIMSLSSAPSPPGASSSSSSRTWNRSARAKRAEHWLVEMIKRSRQGEVAVAPNVRTWGAVLRAWADSGRPDTGEQAQRVLDLMENWYKQGKSSVKPNVVCYTTVINAWARGNSVPSNVALSRVEALLKHMEDLYGETGDSNVRPNKISYISVMDAYGRKSKKSQAADKAQAIVDRMMKLYASNEGYVRPTRIVFNALINAYSKSDDPRAAAQAEKIFRWMEEQYRGGDDCVKPDEITLCGVLNAWANHAPSGGALRAQAILDHTESLSMEERGFAHSTICHNILIKAWGRSREPDSVQRAEGILKKLEDQCQSKGLSNESKGERSLSICPDVTTYSSVINCCAYFSGDEAGRREALQVALRTFSKIKNDEKCHDGPNNITFGTLLKAVAKLMVVGSERESLVESLFQQCQELGQVDSFVLSQVRAASSGSQLYRKLVLEAANLTMEDGANYDKILKSMPREWRSNIVAWDG